MNAFYVSNLKIRIITPATFQIKVDEGYVRAKVIDSNNKVACRQAFEGSTKNLFECYTVRGHIIFGDGGDETDEPLGRLVSCEFG
jgi:hypothetical protein